tara:strand:- start:97 stop:1332 length:1236 start_codon:yes stop_codon:yes gene_type:complete
MPTDIKDLTTHTADLGDFIAVQDSGGTGGKVALSSIMALGSTSAFPINLASATALTVGPNGATNPCLTVDTNTSSAATGISITGAAAAAGVALATISSGTNEDITLDAKGSGTITLGGTSTGAVITGTNLRVGSAKALEGGGAAASSLIIYGSFNDATSKAVLIRDGNLGLGLGSGGTPTSLIHCADSLVAATGNEIAYDLSYTVNKATSGNTTGLLMNMTDTASPGTNTIADFQVGAVSKWNVTDGGLVTQAGGITFTGAQTIQTTTGNVTISSDSDIRLVGDGAGIRYIQMFAFDAGTDCETGNGASYVHVPAAYAGMNLVEVHAEAITAGTTGTMDIQIHNVTQTADMLSTKITLDSTESGSDTAATPAVIDTSNDDVAVNDMLRIDVDAVQTTAAKGLLVTMGFRLP